METSMSINGRVVIPAKIRQRLGLKPGTKLSVEERNGEIVLRPLNSASYQKMSGILRRGGLTKGLELARREDLKREEKKVSRGRRYPQSEGGNGPSLRRP